MSTNRRSEIMTQLITTCEFPKATDLADHTCYICQEDTLAHQGSEIPIKLRCGHILGMACLTNWVFQLIENDLNFGPGCPFCRLSLLQRDQPSQEALRIRDEKDMTNIWLPALASWTPGGDEVYRGQDPWIHRAEKLWDDLCNEILDDLDSFPDVDAPHVQIELFICCNAVIAERFLSFGSVFQFYQAFRLGYSPEEDIWRNFGRRCRMLIEHLKTAEAEVNEESWRVRQAFQGPQNQLDGFRRRMERSRANLSQQLERVRRGEN